MKDDILKEFEKLHKELRSPLRTRHTRRFMISGLDPFSVTFDVIWTCDSNYGADADGRRGRSIYTPTGTDLLSGVVDHLNKEQLVEFHADMARFLDVLEAP